MFKSFVHLGVEGSDFLLLVNKDSLYILDRSFLDVEIENIFSHIEAYLFTF